MSGGHRFLNRTHVPPVSTTDSSSIPSDLSWAVRSSVHAPCSAVFEDVPFGKARLTVVYSDGKTERRVWRLTDLGGGRWRGEADDVVGEAQGQAAGNALNWRYTLALNVDGRTIEVPGVRVTAAGDGTLSYQWQKNQTNLNSGGHYSGCTTNALTITGADNNDAASYRCVVTNAYGSATSAVASNAFKGTRSDTAASGGGSLSGRVDVTYSKVSITGRAPSSRREASRPSSADARAPIVPTTRVATAASGQRHATMARRSRSSAE